MFNGFSKSNIPTEHPTHLPNASKPQTNIKKLIKDLSYEKFYVINSFQKILRCIESNNHTFSSNETTKECSEIIQSVYLNDSYHQTNKINDDWHMALNYIDILWQQKSFKSEILNNNIFYCIVNESSIFIQSNYKSHQKWLYCSSAISNDCSSSDDSNYSLFCCRYCILSPMVCIMLVKNIFDRK